jgi:hypothetical protein
MGRIVHRCTLQRAVVDMLTHMGMVVDNAPFLVDLVDVHRNKM